jgi:hypothetical protein
MPRIGESQIKKEITYPELSKQELHALDAELDKYAIEKELSGKMIRYVPKEGIERWFFDRGATTETFSIKNIPLFKECQNRLEQHSRWLGRKEYAIKMQDKNYEEQVSKIGTLSNNDF